MIPTLLLLSATLFATPVFISEVRATREAGHLRVEVRADGGIDPEAARTRIDEGRLILILGGTHVRADNRSWELDEGVGEIRAHRHRTETELEVPLIGNGCSGPVELQGTPTGMTALVGCDGSAPAVTARGGAERRSARAARATETAPIADTTKLEKLVALPPGGPAEPFPASVKAAGGKALERATEKMNAKMTDKPADKVAEKPAEKTPVKATERPPERAEPAVPVEKAPVAAASKGAAAAPVAIAVAKPAPAAPAPVTILAEAPPKPVEAYLAPTGARSAGAPGAASAGAAPATSPALPSRAPEGAEVLEKAAGSGGTSLRIVATPALLLGGLALAAYLFARRRRVPKLRQIEILETASLGPKRSLVVARVGEETLVLGTSEAGITLLKTTGGPGSSHVPLGGTLTSALTLSTMLAPALPSPARPPQASAPPQESTPPQAAPSPSAPPLSASSASGAGSPSPELLSPSRSAAPTPVSDSLTSGPISADLAAHAAEMAQPLIEALADVPEPDRSPQPVANRAMFRSIEGGLASLFGRNTPDPESNGRASSASFDDILEDSLEDQELRRKLAAGMSTRVR